MFEIKDHIPRVLCVQNKSRIHIDFGAPLQKEDKPTVIHPQTITSPPPPRPKQVAGVIFPGDDNQWSTLALPALQGVQDLAR